MHELDELRDVARVRLAGDGWVEVPGEPCWLDCSGPGWMKTHRGREIVLCPPHASRLEEGKMFGSYKGAPLPPDSTATAWPWRAAHPVDPAEAVYAVHEHHH